MKKLLKLLNEYAHTYADHYDDTGAEIEIKFYSHTDQCFNYCEDGEFLSLVDDVVISNRFGFIARLIENKKLKPYEATYSPLDGRYCYIGGLCYPTINGQLYDTIICGLANSEEPISDLCKILK